MNSDFRSSRLRRVPGLIASLAFMLFVQPAMAHPGHGPFGQGLAHQLTSPFHLSVLLAFGLACLVATRFLQRPVWRAAFNRAGCGCLLLAVTLWLLRSPSW